MHLLCNFSFIIYFKRLLGIKLLGIKSLKLYNKKITSYILQTHKHKLY